MAGAARRGAELRRPLNPWIRRMALAAAAIAALGVATAGAANVGGITDRVAEAVGLRDGRYHTRSFEPAFSVTLPNDRWTPLVDKNDAFIPAPLGWDGPFGIYKPLGWAPVDEAPSPPPGGFRIIIPGDMIAWLQKHPRLNAGEPTAVTVGGIEGIQIDVEVACTTCAEIIDNPAATRQQIEEAIRNESVTLFYLEDPYFGVFGDASPYLDLTLSLGPRYRVIVFEVQGEDLVIVAPARLLSETPCTPIPHQIRCPDMDQISFDRIIRPMLDSLVFE